MGLKFQSKQYSKYKITNTRKVNIMDKIKINSFELENVKRVKAVSYEPTENGLTVIGG